LFFEITNYNFKNGGALMETFDLKGMGERIRTRREELNISREQLAEQLDVSSKFISDIEYGIRGVSLKRLVLLSSSLLISVDYILFGSLESSEYVFTDLIRTCPDSKKLQLLNIIKQIIDSYLS
jgi:transcriptional regulator, XRE family